MSSSQLPKYGGSLASSSLPVDFLAVNLGIALNVISAAHKSMSTYSSLRILRAISSKERRNGGLPFFAGWRDMVSI